MSAAELTIRAATASDAATLYRFICALAEYEREPHAVEVTPERLEEQLRSASPPFQCLLAFWAGVPVGFALTFHSYSTWKGKRGVFLEDLFVEPAHRGRGVGKALLMAVVRQARESGCGRVEWNVLRWNQPALEFYRSFGAEPLEEWVMYRLSEAQLARLP